MWELIWSRISQSYTHLRGGSEPWMGTNNKNKLNSAQFRVMRAPLYSALVNLISPDLMRKHEHKLCSCKPQNRRLDNIFADNSHILSCFSFCEIFIFHVFCYEKVVVDIFLRIFLRWALVLRIWVWVYWNRIFAANCQQDYLCLTGVRSDSVNQVRVMVIGWQRDAPGL